MNESRPELVGEAFRESEKHFHAFMDNSPALAFLKDEAGRYLYVNEPWLRRFERRPEDVLGKTSFDIWPRETAEQFHRSDAVVLATNEVLQITETFPLPDGTRGYLQVYKFPVSDGSGQRFVAGVEIDITERTQAEEALKVSVERLALIARVAGTVVADTPLDDQMRDLAEAVRSVFGVEACAIHLLKDGDLVPLVCVGFAGGRGDCPDPAAADVAARILALRRPAASLARAYAPGLRAQAGAPLLVDGQMRGLLSVYGEGEGRLFTEMDLEHLQIVANYAAVAVENKRLYEALREQKKELEQRVAERQKAEQALRENEARFRAIFDNSLEAIGVASEGVHVYCNPAYAALFGYARPDDLIGVPIERLLVPSERAGIRGRNRRRERGEEEPSAYETRGLRADGTDFPIDTRVSTYSLNGKIYTAAFHRDITERKRAEAEQKARIEKQQYLTEMLQRALLFVPPADAFPGLTVNTIYEPAWDEAMIGGDFYDAFAVGQDQVALVVGDVMGKGLAAATYTAEVKFALRAFLREYPNASRALSRLNDFICDTHRAEDRTQSTLVALALALVDSKTGAIVVSCAGAEPPLLLRADGQVQIAEAGGMPLGVLAREEYPEADLFLAPGDTFLMITDGVTEARRDNDLLGYERMIQLARQSLNAGSLSQCGQAILDGIRAFVRGRPHDDICLLLARRAEEPRD